MDNLKSSIQNISLYDVKAYVRKAQNVVMNYTETEAKVREATNNEPWGASSTLMQEIANGTFDYTHFNEIMPMIYRRFTEKSAEEWRQIYKALQLLEFLVKNGSERVVDDARSHLSLLQMLKSFHYIDSNGRDQGINVRNRSKELSEMLNDVDKIRSERKKARANKAKYTGVSSDGLALGSSAYRTSRSSGAGYGDNAFGGYSGGVYGDGGGFGGNTFNGEDYGHPSSSSKFEEYDEYDEDNAGRRRHSRIESVGGSMSRPSRSAGTAAPSAPPKPSKQRDVDLFSFDEPQGEASAPEVVQAAEEDEFDDFQSAPPVGDNAPTTAASSPAYKTSRSNITDLFNNPAPTSPAVFSPPISNGPNYSNISRPMSSTSAFTTTTATTTAAPGMGSRTASVSSTTTASKPKAKDADVFSSLWSTASGKPKQQQSEKPKSSLADLAHKSASEGMYGGSSLAGLSVNNGGNIKNGNGSAANDLNDLLL